MVTPIRHGDHGTNVETLQRALERLGHDLPRFGADGWAGDETFDALNEFARRHGLPMLDPELHAIEVIYQELVVAFSALASHATQPPAPPALPPWLHDFRDERVDLMGKPRDWSAVTGITLHQTATCFYGEIANPDPAKLARALARVSKIRAHFVVLRCGHASFNAPLNRVAYHAQRVFNARDVGIEIDGYFEGIAGNARTFWTPKSRPNRKPMQDSAAQIQATRDVIRYIVETVAAHGGEVRHIHAHRQTHRGKPSDPGELIWRACGNWARDALGLNFEIDGADGYVPHKSKRSGVVWSTSGAGRPIPREWSDDPNAPDYFHKP